MSAKIRMNDMVIVLVGKDKGKTGIVKRIYPLLNKAIVTGINIVNKHKKSIPSKKQIGGIIKIEMPIHISNLAIFNKKDNIVEKVKFFWVKNKKFRAFKSNNKII